MRLNYKKIIYMVFAIFEGILFATGWYLTNSYGSNFLAYALPTLKNGWMYVGVGVLCALVLFPISLYINMIIGNRIECLNNDVRIKFSCKRFFFVFGVMEAVYVFVLMLSYPGYLNYDGTNQLIQVLYEEATYSAHHPLFHTLIEGGIIKLGYKLRPEDLSFGVFLYNLFQMTICCLAFSYTIEFIRRIFKSKILYVFSIIFFSLHPTILMFAMSTTKDVFCYLAILLGMEFLYEIVCSQKDGIVIKKYQYILMFLFFTISVLTRKNITYAIVLYAVFVLIFQKHGKYKILMVLLASILFGSIINSGLNKLFHADEASFNEALSIPHQQLNRVFIVKGEDGFTQEELDYLYSISDKSNLYLYDPPMADYSKATFGYYYKDVISKDMAKYFKFWLKKGIENPKIYWDAFLYNTYQGWYPFTLNMDCKGPRYYDITTYNIEWGTLYHKGEYNSTYKFIEDIRFGKYSETPVFRLIFVNGTYFFLLLFCFTYGIANRNKSEIMTILLVLCVVATNLLGPVADVRYYLILFYTCPVILGMCLKRNK